MDAALPSLAVTPGEPAGIGPDLLIQVVQKAQPCELVAYADPELLTSRAAKLGLPLKLRAANGAAHEPGELAVHPVPLVKPAVPGTLDPANSPYVLRCLEQAANDCLAKTINGLVTGPINKAVINNAGIPFSGHTEFLAEKTGTRRVVMMLASEKLKVALATTHLPLKAVPDTLTKELLLEVLEILNRDLRQRFAIASPRILVCGLNPHAGESGHMGREEIDTIIPALEQARNSGIDVRGPFPADTLFIPENLKHGDVVLAMFHDQGLPVLKFQGFGKAVNITLGLPIIRTSVDHGTALDLAGTTKADTGSLIEAINYARLMAISECPR